MSFIVKLKRANTPPPPQNCFNTIALPPHWTHLKNRSKMGCLLVEKGDGGKYIKPKTSLYYK